MRTAHVNDIELEYDAIGQGEPNALGELYALLYPELHRLAHSRVRRSGELTLLDSLIRMRIPPADFDDRNSCAAGRRQKLARRFGDTRESVDSISLAARFPAARDTIRNERGLQATCQRDVACIEIRQPLQSVVIGLR